jgi:hypothetical protein
MAKRSVSGCFVPGCVVRGSVGLAVLAVALWTPPGVAQDAPAKPQADQVQPAPAAPAPAAPAAREESALEKRVRELREAGAIADRLPLPQRPDRYGYRPPRALTPWWYHPYYPWYAVPQTYYGYDEYPPTVQYTPRLGLQHTYLGVDPFGIRVPEDSEPLEYEPNLGRFVGIVGAAKADLAGMVQAEMGDADDDGSLALMRAGKHRDAGRRLAARLEAARGEDDPRTLLLLGEVFFALDKPAHAELLLEQALLSDAVVDALPADVGGHFPSRDEFEAKVQDLGSNGEHKLLLAYLSLHTRKPQAGLDLLRALAKEMPNDAGVQKLYRHYLSRAFQE